MLNIFGVKIVYLLIEGRLIQLFTNYTYCFTVSIYTYTLLFKSILPVDPYISDLYLYILAFIAQIVF